MLDEVLLRGEPGVAECGVGVFLGDLCQGESVFALIIVEERIGCAELKCVGVRILSIEKSVAAGTSAIGGKATSSPRKGEIDRR